MRTKKTQRLFCLLLAAAVLFGLLAFPASAKPDASGNTVKAGRAAEPTPICGVNPNLQIDDNAAGGYEGDYVVIYNPATSASTSYSTGTMTGRIETSLNASQTNARASRMEETPYIIDVDAKLATVARTATTARPVVTQSSYTAGETRTFTIYAGYSPTGSSSVEFKCLYVGQHCYIWTPTSVSNTYPLDQIDPSYAQMAAAEFDSKFDLMQSSFGNHSNGTSGDGKLHILYYNIDDGWTPGLGYVAGFYFSGDLPNNGLPILNIDTYPGVYKVNASGVASQKIDRTYKTMVHEYQHLINASNTPSMNIWLNECFSAAAEEICYPGSSLVSRIQSWENYKYSTNNDWLNPPTEFEYTPSYALHNGYSLYDWNSGLSDVVALYGQVSLFSQYLFTRFGNTIYQQISNCLGSSGEVAAITAATGVNCSDLARDFRVAVTANAAQDQYNGLYGFRVQNGYNPSEYHNVQSPYDLLSPVVFTGTSCSIQGGGAITVKPVNGVYYPPADANANLQYIGIRLSAPAPTYTVTAVSNNTAYGTVSVNGTTVTAIPQSGYYVSDVQVTSGAAAIVVNGNVITVNPSSDCTVTVTFEAVPHTHSYGAWISNQNGTHSRACACGETQTANCAYTAVVTPPTTTSQGYTTHTCTVCGDSYIDSYTAPLETCTVTFSVPGGVSAPASQTVEKNAYITLPTAGAPTGYTFLGWVTAAVNNATTMPSCLNGTYQVTQNVTLRALYSYSSYVGVTYERLPYALADWTGSYVITYGTNGSTPYVLKGLSGNTSYQNTSCGGTVALANSGIQVVGNRLTGVTSAYVFTAAKQGSYYSLRNNGTGTYLGSYSRALASRASYSSTYCRWTLSCNNGDMKLKSTIYPLYPYMTFSSNHYFMMSSSTVSGIYFWKEVANYQTCYTTG